MKQDYSKLGESPILWTVLNLKGLAKAGWSHHH
jgi:hypothetical protein